MNNNVLTTGKGGCFMNEWIQWRSQGERVMKETVSTPDLGAIFRFER